MTTVRDIIQTAFRDIGVVAQDDAMTDDQGAAGLTKFNNMLSAWALDGIAITFTDLTLDDVFPLADKYREGVGYLVASRLSPGYSAPPGFDADEFFRKIQASYMTIADASIPDPLTWKGKTLLSWFTR
jgi:hypothetical protein